MKKLNILLIPLVVLVSAYCLSAKPARRYKNFNVSIYVRVQEVQKSADLNWLKSRIDFLQKFMHIDKVYLETYRDEIMADPANIEKAKKYLESQGITVAGGIALVKDEPNRFQTFCYSDEKDVQEVKKIVAFTARHFNEIILDDFYFDDCKCDQCILKKGNQSWSQFRLRLLTDVARNVIVKTAKQVNPKVKMVIKFPNWYEHFHYMGYNLEEEPKFFDGIYTGTETRDPRYNAQHLPPYLGYAIMRYFDNVKPGGNGGGWVDPFGRGTIDRYGEQIELTLLAKPDQVNLFDLGDLVQELKGSDGQSTLVSDVAPEAGYEFAKADIFLGQLGKPIGIENYRPYDSSGEDFLPSFLGMLGIPIDMTPTFPSGSPIILLTEDAKKDSGIVDKIKNQLMHGKTVVVTSGLFNALQNRGIQDILEAHYSGGRASVDTFSNFVTVWHSTKKILIPQLIYPTNDSWDILTALDGDNGYPMLLSAKYGSGTMYVLTIPDNFSDMYDLPESVLDGIKRVLMKDMFVRTESPAKVALFAYDNHTFVVHSFLSHMQTIKIAVKGQVKDLKNLLTGRTAKGTFNGRETIFNSFVLPHSYNAYKAE